MTTITDRRNVFTVMRQICRPKVSTDLDEKRHQRKTISCFSRSKASTHFRRERTFTRFAKWRFIHRACLADVQLNAYRHDSLATQRRCRRCGSEDEILPHVLNSCRPFLYAITRRHNAIGSRRRLVVGGRLSLRTNPLAGTSCAQ